MQNDNKSELENFKSTLNLDNRLSLLLMGFPSIIEPMKKLIEDGAKIDTIFKLGTQEQKDWAKNYLEMKELKESLESNLENPTVLIKKAKI